jgi:hypothetical protein
MNCVVYQFFGPFLFFNLVFSFALFRFRKHRGATVRQQKSRCKTFTVWTTKPWPPLCDVCKWVSTYEWGWYELWSMDEHTRGWGTDQCSGGGRVLLQSRKSACIHIRTSSLFNISHMQPQTHPSHRERFKKWIKLLFLSTSRGNIDYHILF